MQSEIIAGMKDSPVHVSEKLRELRERADISMDKLGHAMGLAGKSSIQRYLDPTKFNKDEFPKDIVRKLIPILEGRGEPAITKEEVAALAGPEILPNASALMSFEALETALLEARLCTRSARVDLSDQAFARLVVHIAKQIQQAPNSTAESRGLVLTDYARALSESDDNREAVDETRDALFGKAREKTKPPEKPDTQ